MLTSIEILKLLKPLKNFGGVYSIDNLPLYSLPDRSFIINLDEKYKEGSHWVALYINKNRRAYYFDSFGRPPQAHILTFIKRTAKNGFDFNKNKYQANESTACGYFCIIFILMCKNLKKFHQMLRKCAHLNNEIKIYIMMKRLCNRFIISKRI